MRQSQFPIKTLKEAPKDEEAINAIFLTRAGFIQKVGAGIYSYLPLGLKVIKKIEAMVRQEIDKIGGVELLMPALHPKSYWVQTGRWQEFNALYKIKVREDREYALGPTHEEIIVPLAKNLIQSYKDLPLYLYQIQTKFRDEPRAKSGLLRGHEFIMKDLYSFHKDERDLQTYYERVAHAYQIIFKRCGLESIRTEASGGTFSKFSHEYQVITAAGEDIVFYCKSCKFARNKEIMQEGQEKCQNCNERLKELKVSEVGNIFKLGVKYSESFDLTYQDKGGQKYPVIMGCYGIGISRLMGTIVEVHHDENGIIWPEQTAPFRLHLLGIWDSESIIRNEAEKIYSTLKEKNFEVLYDDRKDKTVGGKLVEADLIGIPWRVVISERTLRERKIEVKRRCEDKARLVTLDKFLQEIKRKA